jgi:hypothetical protein
LHRKISPKPHLAWKLPALVFSFENSLSVNGAITKKGLYRYKSEQIEKGSGIYPQAVTPSPLEHEMYKVIIHQKTGTK